jgi:hypothetical protein
MRCNCGLGRYEVSDAWNTQLDDALSQIRAFADPIGNRLYWMNGGAVHSAACAENISNVLHVRLPTWDRPVCGYHVEGAIPLPRPFRQPAATRARALRADARRERTAFLFWLISRPRRLGGPMSQRKAVDTWQLITQAWTKWWIGVKSTKTLGDGVPFLEQVPQAYLAFGEWMKSHDAAADLDGGVERIQREDFSKQVRVYRPSVQRPRSTTRLSPS